MRLALVPVCNVRLAVFDNALASFYHVVCMLATQFSRFSNIVALTDATYALTMLITICILIRSSLTPWRFAFVLIPNYTRAFATYFISAVDVAFTILSSFSFASGLHARPNFVFFAILVLE